MTNTYVYAVVYSGGKSIEHSVDSSNERLARKKLWEFLPDEDKNNIESIELMERTARG